MGEQRNKQTLSYEHKGAESVVFSGVWPEAERPLSLAFRGNLRSKIHKQSGSPGTDTIVHYHNKKG